MTVALINEYRELLTRREGIVAEMRNLPRGYVSKKTIKGRLYYYLQSRVNGRLVSKYVKKTELDDVLQQIARYRGYKILLPKIAIRLSELEQAAELLDKNISRKLVLVKISMGMDKLDADQKDASISFASAMNAIEGISISNQTELDIADWRNGNRTFASIFQKTLKRYGFAVEG